VAIVNLAEIVTLLCCPRCQHAIARTGDGYSCENAACLYHVRPFKTAGSWPVFVDYDKSILVESEVLAFNASSPVGRAPRLGRRLGRMLFPPNPRTERNISRFVEALTEAAPDPLVLVIGGGEAGSGANRLYGQNGLRTVSFDIYGSPLTQFVADAHDIPLSDGCVDGVVIQAVLEHVLDPWRVVAEAERVLKPTGLLYAETAFLQQVHDGPYDFVRFTESGHRWLFNDFDRLDSGRIGGPGTQMLWSIDYLVRSVARQKAAGRLARLMFFWLRYLDGLAAERFAIDSAAGVFFLGRRTARPIRPREMVNHYMGAQRPQRDAVSLSPEELDRK